MSSVKTKADLDMVTKFIIAHIDDTASSIIPLTGGELAQAYEVISDRGNTIFKLNPRLDSLEKDKAAADRFGSLIPIPKVYKIGSYDESLHYSLAEKASGMAMSDVSKQDLDSCLPSFMQTLGEIHLVNIEEDARFGNWNTGEEESYDNFQDYMSYLIKKEMPIARDTKEEVKIERYLELFRKGTDCIDVRPHLLHGDYSFDNVFASPPKVTSVIDWGASLYGDPVFDLAWPQFWYKDIDTLKIYVDQNKDMIDLGDNINERMISYLCYIGLRSLWFFSKSNQESARDWTLERLDLIGGKG